jgi:hypothetical protein
VPPPLYLYAKRHIYWSPQKGFVNLPDTSRLFEQRLSAHRENLLIWFDQEQEQRPYLFSLDHLSARFALSLVKHFSDANVYVIGAR